MENYIRDVKRLMGASILPALLFSSILRAEDRCSTPEKTLDTYLTAVNNREWSLYIDSLSERYRRILSGGFLGSPDRYETKEGREELFYKLDQGLQEKFSWQIISENVKGGNVTIHVKLSNRSRPDSFTLKREDDCWVIDNID